MGRELKRVALDFDWPLNKVWRGFLNPFYRKCPDCKNGNTQSYAALERLVRILMIAGEDSVIRPKDYVPNGRQQTMPWGSHERNFPHPYLLEAGIDEPGTELHELTGGLAGRPPRVPFGHDSSDSWSACKAIIKAAGLDPEVWGICPTCKGNAEDPATKEQSDAWKEEEPPAGEGWQLWETVSEGSPISPVFPTRETFVEYLVSQGGYSRAAAEGFSEQGWAPSMVIVQQGDHKVMLNNIESCAMHTKEKP